MSLSSSQRWQQTTAAGVNAVIPVQFKFFDPTDLIVIRTRAGVDSTLVNVTDYAVTGGGTPAATGTVTIVGGLAADVNTITGGLSFTQAVDLTTDGPLPALLLTAMFDRQAMLLQQLNVKMQRLPVLPLTAAVQAVFDLPYRAGKTLGYDSAGNFAAYDNNIGVSKSVISRLDITSFTGGMVTSLDAVPTGYQLGTVLTIQPGGFGQSLIRTQLVQSAAAPDGFGVVQPLDNPALRWFIVG